MDAIGIAIDFEIRMSLTDPPNCKFNQYQL